MLAPNSRIERRQDIIKQFEQQYTLNKDFSAMESREQFLESTGSLVLDRVNNIAYAARSPRTDDHLVQEWCRHMGYEPVLFDCLNPEGVAEYHTNVVMFVGTTIAALYTAGIPEHQRAHVVSRLQNSHTVIELTYQQVQNFCGNALEVCSRTGQRYLIMSQAAYTAFTPAQKAMLSKTYDKLLYSDLSTIETYGGGSARCLLLELF